MAFTVSIIPAALFPWDCWECVKTYQTVEDQLIIACY